MLKHYNFVPFGTTELPAGSALVFAPHPDDETFGAGGSILKLTDNKQTVHVVIMTDGAVGGDEELRKEELLGAAEMLGVNECHFFGAPDQGLDVNTVNIQKVIHLLQKYKPDNVFFPSPLEYHPDHRATAWLVWDALQSVAFKGNVFSYEVANQSPISMLVDITSVMEKKIEVMRLYVSQNEQVDYLDTVTAINRTRAYTASSDEIKYAEGFFRFPDVSLDLMSYYYRNFNLYHKGMISDSLPLVSILVRTKDRPELLKNALDSIARQTYQQFEVNIVNDGGSDIQHVVDTFGFARCFVKTHESSQGRAAAANALLKMIQGTYCIFLDDDDTFDADHVENLVRVIKQNENMLACYSGIRVGHGVDKPPFNQPYNAALYRKMNFIPFHAVLFSSKLIAMDCRFDESLLVYEDWDFWLQIAQHTEFYHLNKITATYNINGGSRAGGAGGHSLKEKDLHFWTLKVYEKWSRVWSSGQLGETFRVLAGLNAEQLHNARKENLQLREKLKVQATEQENAFNEQEMVINEQIAANDPGDPAKRNFTLVSAGNYGKQCRDLYEEVFEHTISKEFWNWKYGGVDWRGICALKEGKIIAHYNGMPRDILYFGKPKRVFQACDTMVAPLARGGIKYNSPFYNITKTWILINLGREKEFLLAYGFPNKRVMKLAEMLNLYAEVDQIVEITWKAELLPDISKDIFVDEFTLKSNVDNEVNQLWQKMAGDFNEDLIGIRNVHHIKRRYLHHPALAYQCYLVRDKKGLSVGLFVLKRENKKMLLMDIVAGKEDFYSVIYSAIKISQEAGVDDLKCWITQSKAEIFLHHDAIVTETDVRIPTSAITPRFSPETIKNRWFLMYGDTDFI